MKISILSTFDIYGGAAIAALRLCKGLRLLNQDAFMIVKEKQSREPFISKVQAHAPGYEIEKKIFQDIQYVEIDRDRTDRSNTRLSFPYPGYDLSQIPFIAASEIINLHWVVGFQSVETIAALLKLGKPVVWTMHDENPYTGGCHYAAGCQKYREDCSDCLQLKENPYQIPFHVLENKIASWQNKENLTIVTPSRWLAACAGESRIFKDVRIEIIPNSLETDIFKPKPKDLAKKELGMDPRTFTLLFGAATGNEKRKGFYKLMAAMKYTLQDETFRQLAQKGRIKILTFGPPQQDLEELAIEIKPAGYIKDNEKLATLYSAADLFVLPSLEDNLPNTVLEAMACGTPVIAFRVGGIPDMIEDGITGYMAPPFDSRQLGTLILKLLTDENKRKQMKLNCRQLIEKKFKLQDQASSYLNLYRQLLADDKKNSHREHREHREYELGREIILQYRESSVHKDFFELYRKWALRLLISRQRRKIPLKKLSRVIKWPFKKAKAILRKVRNISPVKKILRLIKWPLKKAKAILRKNSDR